MAVAAPSDEPFDPRVEVSIETLGQVPLERIEHEICTFAGQLAAATCRMLLLVAEFDRRSGWEVWGIQSMAHWLSWRCGFSPGAARERVRVARSLSSLPLVTSHFLRGELSYAKVRAVSRVATPLNEDMFLEMALEATTPQLERFIRGYRRGSLDEVNERHQRRLLSWFWNEEGSLEIRGRLSPEDGALFIKGLEKAREGVSMETSHEQKNADALAVMAETVLASGPSACQERHSVMVVADAETLASDEDGTCVVDDNARIEPETARRLSCDASVVPMLIGSRGQPLDIGRKSRSIPPAIKRALHKRDNHCRFTGCNNRAFVDGHHIKHWSQQGATSLDNLVLLCRHHHRAVHEGGFSINKVPTGFMVTTPHGDVLQQAPPIKGSKLPTFGVGPDACTSRSNGERFSLNDAVTAFLSTEEFRRKQKE